MLQWHIRTIDPQNYNAIWAKNPNVLACLTTDSGQFLGYFDVIPLKSSFAEMFIAGKLTEDQLTHDEVCLPSEAPYCRYLFVSGLAVLQSDSFVGRRNASLLVWALLKYLDHYYSPTHPTTFALAATKEGDDLLNRFRLNVAGERESRADHYKLYSLHLTKEEIARRLACLPDWSGLCVLDWSQPETFVLHARRPALPQMHHSALKAASQ